MGFKLIDTKVLKVTRPLAEKFRDMTPAPGDRGIRDWRMDFIKNEIEAGRWRVAEWAYCKCKADGQVYRVNGKHTSNVMAGMNGNLRDLKVVVEEYTADTLTDVADLYTTFDSKSSMRSTGDINRSFARCVPELCGATDRIVNLAVAGIRLALAGGDLSSKDMRSHEAAATHIPGNADFILWLQSLHAGSSRDIEHVFRASVAGVMYLSYEKHPKLANEFWPLVRDGSGPDHTAADRVLHKMLRECRISSRSSTVRTMGGREMYVRCIHGWNAWRKGEKTKLRYYAEAEVPKLV